MHVDRYDNYTDLLAGEVENKDFTIGVVLRPSVIALIAPHGGGIEYRSSVVATEIAGSDFNLYVFQGIKKNYNFRDLHITSHHFDEPICLDLLSRSDFVVAIHGCEGRKQFVLLGGLDIALKSELRAALGADGIEVVLDPKNLAGADPQNICNRGRSRKGVQIERSRALRGSQNERLVVNAVRRVLLQFQTFSGQQFIQ